MIHCHVSLSFSLTGGLILINNSMSFIRLIHTVGVTEDSFSCDMSDTFANADSMSTTGWVIVRSHSCHG